MFQVPTLSLFRLSGALRSTAAALLLATLAACGTTSQRADPGPGYHVVQSSETLSSIARRYGRSVDDLVRWNKLKNPNRIYVSQVLQVVADPSGSPASAASGPGATRAAPAPPAKPQAVQPPRPQGRPTVAPPANAIQLAWPADGKTGRSGSRPGVLISSAAGTPVKAAAAGWVAYVGSGLRGYGNLVILRHASEYMTVYAHNRRLLVKEGAQVRQGQPLAEMGDTDASQVGLYFEVRHKGEPIDPLRMLPKR